MAQINLNFIDSINRESAKEFVKRLKEEALQNPDAEEVIVNISSPGGEIDVAVMLFGLLRELKCRVTTRNISVVNSAAVILFLAGDIRECAETSTFYIHSVMKRLRGSFDATRLFKEAKELKTNTDRVASILASRTGISTARWKRLMKEGVILSARRSETLGISTAIYPI